MCSRKCDCNRIKKFGPDISTRVLGILGGMSMGKTYQLKAFIETLQPEDRVLFITPRKSLSETQKGLFRDFIHYKTKNWTADRLICQYESLHHLEGQKAFDYILIDETRSVMSNLTCIVTNQGFKLRANANMLRALMQASKLAICLDAHLEVDGAVPKFLQDCFEPSQIEVHRYLHQRMKRSIHALYDSSIFEQALQIALETKKKVGLLCRTKSNALVYAEKHKECKTAIFTSETDDEVLEEFQESDKFLADIQLLIMTSKVTVGADIQLMYDEIFVDFRGQGCSARNILQMCGRFRELRNSKITFFVEKDPEFKENLEQNRFLIFAQEFSR